MPTDLNFLKNQQKEYEQRLKTAHDEMARLRGDKDRINAQIRRAKAEGNKSVLAMLEGSLAGINARIAAKGQEIAGYNLVIVGLRQAIKKIKPGAPFRPLARTPNAQIRYLQNFRPVYQLLRCYN